MGNLASRTLRSRPGGLPGRRIGQKFFLGLRLDGRPGGGPVGQATVRLRPSVSAMVLGGLTMAEQPSLAVQASIARPVAPSDDVAQQRRRITRIKRVIRRQTSGGIRELTVDLEDGSVRLRGRCSSFYCKQMAQQAAMTFLPGETIVNEIEVAALPR